jgi:general secretion pathway protein C
MGQRLYGSVSDPHPAAATAAAAALPLPVRAAAGLATVLAAALLALAIADGFWRLAGPAPVTVPPAPPPDSVVAVFAGAPLFGGATAAPEAGRAAPLVAASAPGDLRLLGVIAGRDGGGHALFRLADRGPVLIPAGQDVIPGVRLDAVFADRVRLTGHGETREILLRQAVPLASPAATAPAASAARPAALNAACAPPAGFKGPVYRINAELLSGMAAQPQSWKDVLGESAAGLVVREGGGFAAMLGLKPGDRLREANGIALSANGDLIAAVVRPLQGSQPVRVRGTREGAPLELLLVNASACASR